MQQESLDRVLTTDEEIVPSSGLAGAVMEAVRRETSRPMPIPFPWKRALPGLLLAGLVVVAAVFVPMPRNGFGGSALSVTGVAVIVAPILLPMRKFGLNCLVGALLLSSACVRFSTRLASWRS
jgi:hypothetical protein